MNQNLERLFRLLQNDIDRLEEDWEDLLSHKKEVSDQTFLKKMADDIKQLHEDSRQAEKVALFSDQAHLIQHILTTPWGAPVVSDTTLLEAALSLDVQQPLRSDLCHLLEEFTIHSSVQHNGFVTLLQAISADLDAKAKEQDEQ